MSKEHLARAARMLQAIADDTPRRGLKLSGETQAKMGADVYTPRAIGRGHLALGSPAGTYAIRIEEVSARSDQEG